MGRIKKKRKEAKGKDTLQRVKSKRLEAARRKQAAERSKESLAFQVAGLLKQQLPDDERDAQKRQLDEKVQKLTKQVQQYDEEITKYREKEDEMMIDINEDEVREEGGEESSQHNPSQPTRTQETEAGPSQPVEDPSQEKSQKKLRDKGKHASNPITEEDMDLIRPESHQPISGLKDPDKYRHIECTKNWRQNRKLGIVRYGPKNASIYRREDVSDMDLNDVPDITKPSDRPGERHERGFPSEKKLKYFLPSRQDRVVYAPTDVLVKWSLDGVINKSWETRTVLRRLWGKQGKGPDWVIYEAAQPAERRFEEWKAGERRSQSRSATPYPAVPEKDGDDGGGREGEEEVEEGEEEVEIQDNKVKNDKRQSKSKRKGRSKKASKSREESDESDESSDSSDDDERSRRKSKGKKHKGKSRRPKKPYDESDESEDSSDSDDSDDRHSRARKHRKKTFDPVKFEKAWCYTHGKDIHRLSKKDLQKLQRAVRKAFSYLLVAKFVGGLFSAG